MQASTWLSVVAALVQFPRHFRSVWVWLPDMLERSFSADAQ